MCTCAECNEKIKRLEQALDVSQTNRKYFEELSNAQALKINELLALNEAKEKIPGKVFTLEGGLGK